MTQHPAQRLAGLLALVAGSAGLLMSGVPAQAASTVCSSSEVDVVVDPGTLGGAVRSHCVEGGGPAADLFEDAGFALEPTLRSRAFVCRVLGQPASDPCVNIPPADAYWALFWAEEAADPWVFASQGAYTLVVPDGARVGLSWQDGADPRPPGGAADRVSPSETDQGKSEEAPGQQNETAQEEQPTVPTWLVVGLVIVVFLGAAATALVRRRGSGGS